MTTRSGSLDHLLTEVGQDALRDGVELLAPMRREQLHAAVTGPLSPIPHVRFEPDLVARLLDDAESQPGSLPLLEFTLTRLWDRRRGRRLNHDAYEALGGVTGALADYAEEVFRHHLRPAEQATAGSLFVRLARPTGTIAVDVRTGRQSAAYLPGAVTEAVLGGRALMSCDGDRAVRVTEVDAGARERRVALTRARCGGSAVYVDATGRYAFFRVGDGAADMNVVEAVDVLGGTVSYGAPPPHDHRAAFLPRPDGRVAVLSTQGGDLIRYVMPQPRAPKRASMSPGGGSPGRRQGRQIPLGGTFEWR
ncbi:nSTAND1 domain-containing NTPase [Streptomyces sp. URMC 123]|uniref:nSTAND1 domain-containing NTPase n=1 Tax=Streptomyces sp. URMC 123 TaxID=3423403 RepID=UPI003F1D7D2E